MLLICSYDFLQKVLQLTFVVRLQEGVHACVEDFDSTLDLIPHWFLNPMKAKPEKTSFQIT